MLCAPLSSVKRRLEVKAEVNGITIIDDFAHTTTRKSNRRFGRCARVIRPRACGLCSSRARNTMRRNVLQEALAGSLAVADEVIIANIFKSEAIPEEERLDLNQVAVEIQKRGRIVKVLADADAIVASIAPQLRSGDVVAILSNGGFGGIYEKLPERLRKLGAGA